MTLFKDGFESGDTSKCSATSTTNGTITVQPTTKHHGRWAVQFVVSGGVGSKNNNCTCRIDIAEKATVHLRTYIKSDLSDTGGTNLGFILFKNSVNGAIAWALLQKSSAGPYRWGVNNRSEGTTYWGPNEPVDPRADKFYYVELRVVIHNTAGEIQLWVNGISKVHETSIDTDNYGNVDQVIIRLTFGAGDQTSDKTAILDCIIVSDKRIGPEKNPIMKMEPSRRPRSKTLFHPSLKRYLR